jgi:hypothetical protein
MKPTNTGIMKITYNDGAEQSFEYIRAEVLVDLINRIQAALNQNHLLLELENRLLIIPFNSIKMIEISPPPPKLPNTTIRFAKAIGP